MKKLKHYPTMWQTYPFSMELFIAAQRSEAERRAQKQAMQLEKDNTVKKSKFKLAFNLW